VAIPCHMTKFLTLLKIRAKPVTY